MEKVSANTRPLQQIDLNTLNVQQLHQIKQQLDQEMSVFQDSLQTLKMAQNKFQDSADNMSKIEPKTKGNDIMVPLTSSIYVAGKITDDEHVLIDIGTGYYVSMSITDAQDYFKRKVEFVTDQMEKIQVLGRDKSKVRQIVIGILESRIKTQMAMQEKASKAAAGTITVDPKGAKKLVKKA